LGLVNFRLSKRVTGLNGSAPGRPHDGRIDAFKIAAASGIAAVLTHRQTGPNLSQLTMIKKALLSFEMPSR
jgi:hypothetical protein